ncbi:hypothetical protein ZHAS_00013708 [Anopheles sinensis]|uniref:Uncharacterized protein n=1 Tax=Anopheles sinensis TaxID=74873 RepID=A0A084W676_ANOSI|nr:hypothetical protein ZHAS_00013708 [Anopheles sinensis]
MMIPSALRVTLANPVSNPYHSADGTLDRVRPDAASFRRRRRRRRWWMHMCATERMRRFDNEIFTFWNLRAAVLASE